jgi:hypothetical protein
MSTRKLGTYATREEFLENEIRTLNYHIQSMIDTMKVMSMNRQDMSEELERMKQEIKSAVLAEREACAKLLEQAAEAAKNADSQGFVWIAIKTSAEGIRARGQE